MATSNNNVRKVPARVNRMAALKEGTKKIGGIE